MDYYPPVYIWHGKPFYLLQEEIKVLVKLMDKFKNTKKQQTLKLHDPRITSIDIQEEKVYFFVGEKQACLGRKALSRPKKGAQVKDYKEYILGEEPEQTSNESQSEASQEDLTEN